MGRHFIKHVVRLVVVGVPHGNEAILICREP